MYGERLKELAKSHNLVQKDLAKIAKAPESSVSRWINQQYPPLKFIYAICAYVNEPVWQFFLDDPAEISQHPINTLDPKDIEVLQALNRIEPDLRDAVWRAWRQLLEGLVAHCEKDRAR